MFARSTFLLGCAALASAATHEQSWLYSEVDNRGPKNWESTYGDCSKSEQSPINIAGAAADRDLQPLEMHYTAATSFTLLNNQHAVKVVPTNNDGNYLLDPNNGNKRYNLAQLHFHSPSEHGIGGGLYDLEMHMVHTLADTSNTNEKFQYLVVGVLFRSGNTPNEHFGFFDNLPVVPMTGFDMYANQSATFNYNEDSVNSTFNFNGVLSSRRFFTYDGSFTTPPCTEGVKWYVMQDVQMVHTAQVSAFRNAMMFTEELVVAATNGWSPSTFQMYGNNRPVQPLNSRTVRSFDDAHSSNDDDHSEAWKLGVAAVVLGCVAIVLALAALFAGMASGGSQPATASNEPVADEELPKTEEEPKAEEPKAEEQ